MDGNGWRPAQGDPNIDSNDWRTQLTPESRQRIVNKIMETLKDHLPFSDPDGIVELKQIAARFEEKIYIAATSQTDYLWRIASKMLGLETVPPKMLTMETESQTNVPNSLPLNPATGNQNQPDPEPHNIQPQVRNPGPTLPMSMPNQSQARPQLLAHCLQNTISSVVGMQSSTNLSPALSSMTRLTQTTMSNVIGKSSGLQNTGGVSQNSVNNSVGQGVPSSMFASSQRLMQARQQITDGDITEHRPFRVYQRQRQPGSARHCGWTRCMHETCAASRLDDLLYTSLNRIYF